MPPTPDESFPLSQAQWKSLREEIQESIREGLETPRQLHDLGVQMARLMSHVESEQRNQARTAGMVDDHQRALYGTGDNPGIRGKVNMLVTAKEEWDRGKWMMITIGIGLLATTIWNIILQYGKP